MGFRGRRHRGDRGDAGFLLVEHDIAWQCQSDVRIVLQSRVRHGRIARAENFVRRVSDVQLFLESRLNVDFHNDPEMLFLQSGTDVFLRLGQR